MKFVTTENLQFSFGCSWAHPPPCPRAPAALSALIRLRLVALSLSLLLILTSIVSADQIEVGHSFSFFACFGYYAETMNKRERFLSMTFFCRTRSICFSLWKKISHNRQMSAHCRWHFLHFFTPSIILIYDKIWKTMIMVIIIVIIIDMIQAGLEFDPGQQTVSVALYKCRLKVIKLVETLFFSNWNVLWLSFTIYLNVLYLNWKNSNRIIPNCRTFLLLSFASCIWRPSSARWCWQHHYHHNHHHHH